MFDSRTAAPPWLDYLPSAAYTCDPAGRITAFNRPAAELWGRRPALHDDHDLYCGSFQLFTLTGARVPHDECWMALALRENRGYNEREIVVVRPDGTRRTALAHANPWREESGRVAGALNVLVDITDQRRAEDDVTRLASELEERVRTRTAELEATIGEVQASLAEVEALRGLIQICAWCKKICDEQNQWQGLERYLSAHTRAKFTHAICPTCLERQVSAHQRTC